MFVFLLVLSYDALFSAFAYAEMCLFLQADCVNVGIQRSVLFSTCSKDKVFWESRDDRDQLGHTQERKENCHFVRDN